MYVDAIIDREKEHEGVKFWRFNHDYRKQGTYDKIMKAIIAVGHDITDVETGRDLNIEIAREMLTKHGIPIVAENVEGNVGRKLRFDSGTGQVMMKFLNRMQQDGKG